MECMIRTSLREPVRPQPVGPQNVDPTVLHKSRCLGSFCRRGVLILFTFFGAVDPLAILDPSDDQSWTTHARQSSPCGMLRTNKLLLATGCIESDASPLGKPAPRMLQFALGAAASRLSDATYPPQDLAPSAGTSAKPCRPQSSLRALPNR